MPSSEAPPLLGKQSDYQAVLAYHRIAVPRRSTGIALHMWRLSFWWLSAARWVLEDSHLLENRRGGCYRFGGSEGRGIATVRISARQLVSGDRTLSSHDHPRLYVCILGLVVERSI